MIDLNIEIYKQYTKWLHSLPKAKDIDWYRSPGSLCTESLFIIEGREGKFVQGNTGGENEESVIASLPQGALLKARVFQPHKEKE